MWAYGVSSLIKAKPEGFVLCYHSISDDGWEFSVTFNEFKKQIEYLLQNYIPCSVEDFANYLDGKKTFEKPFFLITFDDGYKSIFQTSDYLAGKGINPLSFLLSATKRANISEMEYAKPFLIPEEIKELKNIGWDFGCHSATHADFNKLSEKDIQT